ncbi:MAG: transposase [Nitrospiraceae bacterium]|nr:MAG: transposase [Nitrospiraceae bacterium]
MNRGHDSQQAELFHSRAGGSDPDAAPPGPIRQYMDRGLTVLSPQREQRYAQTSRPSIPPEKLIRALLLPVRYRLWSERLLKELCRTTCCSVGLSPSIGCASVVGYDRLN